MVYRGSTEDLQRVYWWSTDHKTKHYLVRWFSPLQKQSVTDWLFVDCSPVRICRFGFACRPQQQQHQKAHQRELLYHRPFKAVCQIQSKRFCLADDQIAVQIRARTHNFEQTFDSNPFEGLTLWATTNFFLKIIKFSFALPIILRSL